MKKKLAIALLGVTAFAAMPLFAHAGEETVAIPTDPATYVLVNADAPEASVWTESNGLDGLQTTATVVNDVEIPADSRTL